jgi:ParB-like chromosome segregation protein Spo0J/DNA modification methylase
MFGVFYMRQIEARSIDSLIPYANNSRTHSDAQVSQVAASIKEFGFTNPVLIDEQGGIIAGHGRVMAAKKLGLAEVPCVVLDGLSEAQKKAYIIADNKLALNSGWDADMLKVEMERLGELGFDLSLTGFDDIELSGIFDGAEDLADGLDGDAAEPRSLADRFLIPPFSVLNAREGWWQERKRAWLAMGIKSEQGRDAQSNALGSTFKGSAQSGVASTNTGTSIFDPTLCELAYSWFCPQGGTILDPFAGGSVRGIVASKLGRQYIGVELREDQVAANKTQGDDLCSDPMPVWHTGDSRNIDRICADVQADMVFSCPPYADLEVYSDDPNDLSTLSYEDFKPAYFEIIDKACAQLKDNRFACFVVGDVRDKKGNYYNFVGDTVEAFRAAGLHYYNEAIMITPIGTLGMQTSRNFPIARKLGKTHQNVLVFVKGDGKKATQACGDVFIHIPDGMAGESD